MAWGVTAFSNIAPAPASLAAGYVSRRPLKCSTKELGLSRGLSPSHFRKYQKMEQSEPTSSIVSNEA